jgi:elongation factor P--(R)-beta-lysine ligase
MSHYRQTRLEANLRLRAHVVRAVRDFFTVRGYLEVETPLRIPAPIPETNIDAMASGDWFLHTSPEVCMKRLLAAGYPRIFQICKCFRQAERGARHLPELTMLEWYHAGWTYREMMNACEELICFLAAAVSGDETITYQRELIDLQEPWERVTVAQAFQRFGSMTLDQALACGRFDEIMGLEIEPQLGRPKPIFLCDYPAVQGALARLKPDNPGLAERFELYIAGLELCNSFSELIDPIEQRRRFEEENIRRHRSGKPVCPMPEKFLAALADMPETAGNALGIDRLVMLFADANRIDDVVAFTPEDL